MKIKFSVYLLLAAMVTSLLLSSCAKKEFDYYKEDLAKYVTLGEYKNLSVDVENIPEITNDDVKTKVSALLKEKGEETEVTDRAAVDGDKVKIDYVGKLDGVAFDGGTDTDADLELGSNSFIEGFEDGIIGKTPSETPFDLNLKFPLDYRNTDLAGKEVVFTVTLKSIYDVKLPEYTDAFVAENTDYETIAEYEKSVKDELEATRETTLNNNKLNAVWQKIVENSTVNSVPQQRIDEYVEGYVQYYKDWAVKYEVTYAEFLANYLQTTEEDLLESAKEEAKNSVSQELVFYSIVKAENYKVTDEEYKEGLAKYVAELDFESEEALLAQYSAEEVRNSLLWDKVVKLLAESASINWTAPATTEK